jgi:hypothetical protein
VTVSAEAAAAEGSIPPQSLTARILGVVRRPSATFAGLLVHPRALGVLTVATVVAALAGALLMQTEVGRQALVDQWERTAMAFGRPVDDAQYARLQEMSAAAPEYAVMGAVVAGPVVALGVAGLLFLVFNRGSGRRRSFRQVLAITAHAGVILALRQLVAAPLGYMRETTASATALGVWFPMFDEASPVARFLGLVDVFIVWWAIVLAIGVAVLFGRNARALAIRFVGVYAGLALLLAAVMAVVGDPL